MKKGEKLKRGLISLEKPLYLNANLIYSEALQLIKKPSWKRNIKSGSLLKLQEEGFSLVTSILTRAEVIKKLREEENIREKEARETYRKILDLFGILELKGIDRHVPLTNSFIDNYGKSNLSLNDKLHLSIGKKLKIPVCTHDKKAIKNFVNHEEKKKFYEEVYKPQDLIKPKKKI